MRTLFYMIGKYELTLYTFRYYYVESIDCYFAKDDSSILRPDQHEKGPGLHPDSGTPIICNLTAVARPAAARERRPSSSAGGPQGRLAAPWKNKRKEVLVYIYSIPSAIELY